MKRYNNVFTFEGTSGIAEFFINKWREIGKEAIEKRGMFLVALSGGKTPKELYYKLSREKSMPSWGATHVFQVDERFVSRNHPDNNLFMIRRSLLRNISIPRKNVHAIRFEKTAGRAAERYAGDIKEFFALKKESLPVFDLIALGIGDDGHTASIFSEEDIAKGQNAVCISTNPKSFNYRRISLTLPVINNARNVVFLATSVYKAAAVRRALSQRGSKCPSAMVKPKKGRLFYAFDEHAASLL